MATQTLPLLLLTLFWAREAAAARVVQLVAENPSPFVSADPNDPQFIVSLFEDEDAPLPQAPFTRSTVMTNAAGQQFNCSIPVSPPGAATAVSELEPYTSPAYDLVKSPFELLESLAGMCLYRQDGLWTYEVCHRQQVRQFRQMSLHPGTAITLPMPGGGQAVVEGLVDALLSGDSAKLLGGVESLLEAGNKAEDFICGRYTGDERQSDVILEDLSSSGHPLKYVSHKYSSGASCVLTGQPRTAEVRYTCTRGSQENVVLSVREFPTCNYVVVVSTPFLCKHPSFVPPSEDIRLVSCVPLDAQLDSDSEPQGTHGSKAAAAAAPGEPAGNDGEHSGKATAGSSKAAAAAGKTRKKGSPAMRSPKYVEGDEQGDELLLLRPQHPDEQLPADEYDPGDGYVPIPHSEHGLEQEEVSEGIVDGSALYADGQQEQPVVEEGAGQRGRRGGQQQQQQQQHAAEEGAAGAHDEL